MQRTKTPIVIFVAGLLIGGTAAAWATQSAGEESDPAITGIGGVFFKSDDPEALREWYRRHLGIEGDGGGVNFFWRDRDDADLLGFTVWSPFARDSDYFGPGAQEFMVNYRVRDLDGLLERLDAQGVRQAREIEEYWYGRFAWINDGEGRRVELWEPIPYSPEEFDRLLREQESP